MATRREAMEDLERRLVAGRVADFVVDVFVVLLYLGFMLYALWHC